MKVSHRLVAWESVFRVWLDPWLGEAVGAERLVEEVAESVQVEMMSYSESFLITKNLN